jgi:hypothetical protein
MMMHALKAVALVSTMIAPSPVITAHHEAQIQQQHTSRARLSTTQMYRNFLESGSIYYGDHYAGPPAHIATQSKPTLNAIEHEARQFAFASDPYIPPTMTAGR